MDSEMVKEWQRMQDSLDRAFQRAEELNAAFEKSEKPRQRKIIEILRKNGLPAFIGPFFDAYFRITLQGGDIENLSVLMISRLSKYLGEDAELVARRHRDALSEYVAFMSGDLGESGQDSDNEQFVPNG